MSVIDTFFYLFESDADKLDQGLSETDKRAKQTEHSVKKVDDAAGKLGSSFTRMIAQAGAAFAASVTVGAMLHASMAAADLADDLNDVSEALDVSVEALDMWGGAVKTTGGTAEGFQASMKTLTASLSQIEVTGKSRVAPFFKELGIDLDAASNKGKRAMDFLPEIADSFEKMSKTQSFGIGRKLGLDEGTIQLLQKGRREVEAMLKRQKELGLVTEADAEIAATFNDQMDDTARAFRGIWVSVNSVLLPVLTKLFKGFEVVSLYVKEHKHAVIGLLIALGAAVAVFVLPALYSMAAAAIVAFAPFLLIGAAVAALAVGFALLYDDVMNFVEGNDSLIGSILEKWPVVGDIAKGIWEAIKAIGDAAVWVFETIVSLIQVQVAVWRKLISTVVDFLAGLAPVQLVIDALMAAFGAFGEFVGGIWDALTGKVQGFLDLAGGVMGIVKSIGGAITGGLDDAKVQLGIESGKNQLAGASSTPLASQTSNSISNSARTASKSTSVQTGQIIVQTQATDAGGIAKGIGGALDDQLRQAASNFDDGVLA